MLASSPLWPTEMSLTSSWRKAKVKLILISECHRRQKGGNSADGNFPFFSATFHFQFEVITAWGALRDRSIAEVDLTFKRCAKVALD